MKTLMPYIVYCPGAVMYIRQLMFDITFAAEMLMHNETSMCLHHKSH